MDAEFIERERINAAKAAVFAMRDDAKNHYAATLASCTASPTRSQSSTTPFD